MHDSDSSRPMPDCETSRILSEIDSRQLQSLIDALPAAVVVVNASDRRLTMINQRGAEIHGADRLGYLLTDHIKDLKPLRKDRTPYPLEEMPVTATLQQGAIVRHEEMIIHRADGREMPVLVSTSPLHDAQGRIAAAMIIIDDISDLRQIETALSVSNQTSERQAFLIRLMERLRPIVDPIEVQSITTSMLGEYLNVDRALFGEMENDDDHFLVKRDYHRPGLKSFVGRYALSIAAPTLVANLHAGKTNVIRDIFSELALSEQEHDVYTSRELTAFIMVPLIRDGRMVSFLRVQCAQPHDWTDSEVALVEDVANQTWASVMQALIEDKLRQSEEKFRTVLENSYDGISMLDLTTGKVMYVSASQVDLTGFSLEELQQMSFETIFERIHPEDRDRVLDMETRMRSGTDVMCEVEYRWLVKSGEYRWFSDRRKLVRDEMGQPAAFVGIMRDITPRIQAEAALKAADRNKNRFISILSHELRNPLAAIVLALALLDHGSERPDAVRKATEVIKRQSNQLTHLVDDLLDVTRISENKIKLKKEPVELVNAIERIVADFQGLYDAKGVRLKKALPAAPLRIRADLVRLNQMVGNLLHNALKFTKENDTVSVMVWKDEAENAALIQVQDTGVGIDPSMLASLFEPFRQADGPLAWTQGGLGLGLSIVKSMAEMHGGRVEANSGGLGKGAAFTIHLPL